MVLPRLYPIVDAACFTDNHAMLIAAEQIAAAGCTLLQYRNKSGNARVMLEQARELKRVVGSHPNVGKNATLGQGAQGRLSPQGQNPHFWQNRPEVGHPRTLGSADARSGVRLIMNDRADLCLMAEFDGVHVGQDDLSPEAVRAIIGPVRWLGVSTHNPEQLREADLTSADYLAIGPVFATSSKEAPDPVVGLEGVRRARALTRKPLVAIGGITRANAASVIEAGADSVAVISDLLREPRKSAEEFLRILR
jgi:thiamine-phosphate pyrophosphorylase